MSQYDKFDALVLERLKRWHATFNDLYCGEIYEEGNRIAMAMGHHADEGCAVWGVLKRRLQALRRDGKIRYHSKRGWMLVREDDDIEMRSSYLAMLSAAPKPPALPDDVAKDAARYRWLTDDHKGSVRERRNTILDRMPVMSHSATCAAIDAAMANDPGSQEVQE